MCKIYKEKPEFMTKIAEKVGIFINHGYYWLVIYYDAQCHSVYNILSLVLFSFKAH